VRAVRFVGPHRPTELKDVPTPSPRQPDDVVVRIAGAGVCRTDLHILDDVAPLQPAPNPPFTLGHENAGWIEAVGSSVTGFRTGDPVILHPGRACGLCEACRQGNDMYCPTIRFPGVDGSDGGYAEYVLTSVRALVPLPPETDPAPLAPFADAGITAYHAVKRIRSLTYPGCVTAVIGIGGLGHFGVQLLKAMTPSQVVALDARPERLEFAKRLGADHAFSARDPEVVDRVRGVTGGQGADIVLDFVAEESTPELGLTLLRRGGTYSIVGYGGTVTNRTVDMIVRELRILGNFVGTYRDLVELMELNRQGRVRISMERYPLAEAERAIDDLRHGRILGRAVLVP
jgi:D-arabinose 1-dehydrogenase-like Zn-dependent alcohol dehydrogenase